MEGYCFHKVVLNNNFAIRIRSYHVPYHSVEESVVPQFTQDILLFLIPGLSISVIENYT